LTWPLTERPIVVTGWVLGFSKQSFYQWRARPVTDRDWSEAHLINAATDVHPGASGDTKQPA